MKTKLTTILALAAFLFSGYAGYGQDGAKQNSKEYQIVTREDNYTQPASFTATKAIPVNGAITENVVTTTERILNREAPFLKKGTVKPTGEDKFSAWEFVSDEGGAEHVQTAPNPLTYFAAGAASDLLTQVERGVQLLDLKVDDVKVETKIFFRWSDTMSDKWAGFTDKVVTNILIESNESPEKIQELKQMAFNAWTIGEAFANKTTIDVGIVINGGDAKGREVSSGKVGSPVSTDNGFALTNITPDLKLETVEIEKDLAIEMHDIPSTLVFSEIGIAESAHDEERPYLHRIRAKSLTANYATWELYADDSRGYEGIDKAPSSWDYYTLGTSFCLMSQLTVNHMYFQKQGVDISDFWVEHQFNYQQDDFMTPVMTGRFGDVITRIMVRGEAEDQKLNDFAMQALRCCFAGEGIMNETEMEAGLYLNGEVIE